MKKIIAIGVITGVTLFTFLNSIARRTKATDRNVVPAIE
jgi:hypothetical protein